MSDYLDEVNAGLALVYRTTLGLQDMADAALIMGNERLSLNLRGLAKDLTKARETIDKAVSKEILDRVDASMQAARKTMGALQESPHKDFSEENDQ